MSVGLLAAVMVHPMVVTRVDRKESSSVETMVVLKAGPKVALKVWKMAETKVETLVAERVETMETQLAARMVVR